MARRSRMSILKRQRELRNAEKAARKRARRHGLPEPGITEPQPTAHLNEVSPIAQDEGADVAEEQDPETEPTPS